MPTTSSLMMFLQMVQTKLVVIDAQSIQEMLTTSLIDPYFEWMEELLANREAKYKLLTLVKNSLWLSSTLKNSGQNFVLLEKKALNYVDAYMKEQYYLEFNDPLIQPLLYSAQADQVLKDPNNSQKMYNLYLLIHQMLESSKLFNQKDEGEVQPQHLERIQKLYQDFFSNTHPNSKNALQKKLFMVFQRIQKHLKDGSMSMINISRF